MRVGVRLRFLGPTRSRAISLMSTGAGNVARARILPLVWLRGVVDNPRLELLRKTRQLFLGSDNHQLILLE